MGFPKNTFIFTFFLLCSLTSLITGQVIFKEIPKYQAKTGDSLFFNITDTRSIAMLNGSWYVYYTSDKEKNKVRVNIPSIFQGEADLTFEKSFKLTASQIDKHRFRLIFLGLNYAADISINGRIIYRHTGGEFPFYVNLPKDILLSVAENLLSIKLVYALDSENTIPLKQRYLFPQSFGGIFRDVYIHFIPNISVSHLDHSFSTEPASKRTTLKVDCIIENQEFKAAYDSPGQKDDYIFRTILSLPGYGIVSSSESVLKLKKNTEEYLSQNLDIVSTVYWHPQSPKFYFLRAEIWKDGNLIDRTIRRINFYSLQNDKDKLLLNGEEFQLRGVAYIPSFDELGSLASYEQMEKDIKKIRETGFNAVRFAKNVPHPYYLTLCENYGLLSFIELPLNGVPETLSRNPNFIVRSKNYLTNFIKGYSGYGSFSALGLGGSYLPNSDVHKAYLNELIKTASEKPNVLRYASFYGNQVEVIPGLDFLGIDILNTPTEAFNTWLTDLINEKEKGKFFISEASYTVNTGHTDGYVNEGSYEAQAKFFEDLIKFSIDNKISGFFINSMFDFRGDYASLLAGYDQSNLYRLGILREDRDINILTYKVIYSKLNNTEAVTIPIGSKTDRAPMVFIIFGLLLAIVMGVLVNSGRKFREDASRALLRPYNFFADVRDQRIMSTIHSSMLSLIIAGTFALLKANLLFYFKTDLVLEKILLAFGSRSLMTSISYLAWHPLNALLILSIAFIFLMALLVLIIKTASFFVKTRVYLSSVYFTVVWSFLPYVLLIPVGIILFRVLNAEVANLYIYLSIILFTIWIYYRLMKGIYVIFDVNPGGVYFYSMLFLLLVFGGFLLYYELANSFFDYLQLALKQHNIIG
jgi:beta-galactosidase